MTPHSREVRVPPRRVTQPTPASPPARPGAMRVPTHGDLAARQAALVDALVAGGPVPT
ncbi:MAG: hypothetical protein QOK35_1811, partial [Pseudonocardiales bacterium]|nr:hypothetical protein [Pseudonocardiales bacterium]